MPSEESESSFPKAKSKSVTETATWTTVNNIYKDSLSEMQKKARQNVELFFDV